MIEKVRPLTAVLPHIQNGHTLGLGGMTLYRRPAAFVRALIQQKHPPQNLTLLTFTAGFASDLLIGAGLVSTVRTCYFGLESFGLAPMFTQKASTDEITIIEESEASIANGLRASMAGIGFLPSRAWQGTDLFSVRPDVQTVIDPYSGERLTAFPAISCDVAVIHVLQADRLGNCRLGGNPTVDEALAMVADTTLITAEEIVERLDAPVDIPGQVVTAVTHLPNGAWPTSCYPRYPLDGEEILRYVEMCGNGRFDEYVKRET
ncbi:MAG: CoA transferase subunit A [Ardenticatenaceae bacterium]|nr:CoA transferase subunit A [Anaerolineales bacterium]MCB8921594.1 CoA transferase subunit A [Ardenticatenaceae bacterium]